MKYEHFLEQNESEEVGDPISIDIKTWKADGDYIIGELMDIKPFSASNFETECNQYTFKTDTGLVSTILGGSMDKIFQEKDYIGRILHIKYKGKIDLDDGKRCNKFAIFDLTEAFKKYTSAED